MALRVYMPRGGDRFEAELRSRLPDGVHLAVGPDRPANGYDVLVEGRPSEADLDAFPALRRVVIPWAGVPPGTREALRARPGLTLHNLHHNAAPTAEMAVGLLLAATRRIVPCDQALRRGDWSPRYREDTRGPLLDGARALVLGVGAIGGRVARALVALGMEVTGVTRSGRGAGVDVPVHGPDAIDALLPHADVLVIALPSTPATRGLLTRERLASLPDGAVLVNVARGDVVDEEALFRALEEGHLGGAGLDVWYRYPESVEARASTLPSAFPFHELDNVVLSPHRAGHASSTEARRAEHLARLLQAIRGGETETNRVDLEEGY